MAQFKALKHTWDFPASETYKSFFADLEVSGPGNLWGICWDGTNFWCADISNVEIRKYDANFAFITAIALDAANSASQGVCWDGTNFWVTDVTDNKVYKYTSAWAIVSNHALHASNTDATGIDWDGTFFYVVDLGGNKVFKYNSAWVYQSVFDLHPDYDSFTGIYYDGTDLYLTTFEGVVFRYTLGGVFVEKWVLEYPTVQHTTGIVKVGVWYYIVSASFDLCYRYTLPLSYRTIAGHNNAIVMNDGMVDPFPADIAGNIEGFIRAVDVTEESGFILKDGSGNECIKITINNSKIIGDGSDAIDPALNNKWYPFRVDYDCTANTYDLYIDDVLELNDKAFGNNDDGSGLTQLVIIVDTEGNGFLDGLGFDVRAGYDQGDNANDIVDVTDDIIYCKITEEYKQISFANLRIKGSTITEFIAGHEIDFYDSDNVLSWAGIVLYPEAVLEGTEVVGNMKLLGINTEFNSIFRKNFGNIVDSPVRDSDYLVKHIIDNGLTRYFSYGDEIDNFTLTYRYDMKTMIHKLWNYLTMLERGVLHHKPGGEIFFNKYDNLTLNPQIYPATYNFKDEVGLTSTAISFADVDTGLDSSIIISEFNDHKNVLKIDDATAGNGKLRNNFASEQVA